jgi:hypothetical protein
MSNMNNMPTLADPDQNRIKFKNHVADPVPEAKLFFLPYIVQYTIAQAPGTGVYEGTNSEKFSITIL